MPFSLAPLDPFHRAKELEFVLTEAQTVEIGVYDAQGVLLKHYPPATFPPGRQTLSWDGCDTRGHEVPRGMYLVRNEFGSARTLRRVLLVGGMS